MKYDITVRFEGAGKVSMNMSGDFKAIQEVLYLITGTALLEELVVEKVKVRETGGETKDE